jgi:hypothetical protein
MKLNWKSPLDWLVLAMLRIPRVKTSVSGAVPAMLTFALCVAVSRAHANNYPISAGASAATIQSTINTAAASTGNTVSFAAGSYSPTSSINIPCQNGVVITGPVATPATAVFNFSIAADSNGIFNISNPSACTIEYLRTSGGQAIQFFLGQGRWGTGTGGINILHNQFTGLTAHTYDGTAGTEGPACDSGSGSQGNCDSTGDAAIKFGNTVYGACGSNGDVTNASPACDVLTNTTIEYNQFGDSSSCTSPQNVMVVTGGPGYDYGGNCAGILFYATLNGVTVEYNNFIHVEEGMHVLCGPVGGDDCSNAGSGPWTFWNFLVENNDFSGIHRFGTEMQLQGSNNVHWDHNSFHDPTDPWNWTFGVSNACCAALAGSQATSPGVVNNDNVINAEGQASGGFAIGIADEAWGYGAQYTNNVVQGWWENGFSWAYVCGGSGAPSCPANPSSSISYNNMCSFNGGGSRGGTMYNYNTWISSESGAGNPPTTQTGNTTGGICNSGSAVTSETPTISPASGSFTTSQTVTFTTPNTHSTGIWYTTDGSTPAPYSGTSQYIASGGTIAVSTTTTVKAIGMWGAQNQIGNNGTAWDSGFGYVPSAVVSATYTSGSPPTLNTVTLSAAGGVTSVATGASVQMSAACHYNNSITTNCTTTDAYGNAVSTWSSSSTANVTISGSGLATGVAVGSANLTAVAAGVTSSPFALSVVVPPVTLSSVTLATTSGVTSIVAGSTNQLIATCHYSNSTTTNCTTTDSYGNAPSSWASTAPTIATVSSSGLATGVAVGSANLTAVVAGITSSPALTLSVTAAPPTLQGGYLATPGSANTMYVGGTLQFSAYCYYPGSVVTNCTVADMYGNAVTSWTSSNTASVTIGQVGGANPGLATAVGVGTPYILAHVGSVALSQWDLTVTLPPVSLTGVSLATTGGVTGLFVGQTNQLVATCTYSDGSTTNCTTTDSHGNVAGSYSSSSTSHATVGASTGLVTAVAAGTTNLTAQAGSFTSSALPLTVLAVPTGIYTITISGPVKFSGTVSF